MAISNKQSGFTLIEMMVVVAIFAIVASILLFNYSSFNSDVGVRNLAEEIALSIRQAQTYATSVRTMPGTNDITSDTYPAYGVSFSVDATGTHTYDPTNSGFTLFADVAPNNDGITNNLFDNDGTVCGTPAVGQECLQTFALTDGNTITSICTDVPTANSCLTTTGTVNVVFHRPDPDAQICVVNNTGDSCIDQAASYVTITVQSVQKLQRTITVWNTGQISVD